MLHPLSTAPRIDEQQIRALPKAEVHVHLEGTFSLIDLLALAKENGIPLPGPAATIFDISTHDGYTAPDETSGGGSGAGAAGLTGFLRFLDWQCGLVRTPQQAARVAYAFAARQTAAGAGRVVATVTDSSSSWAMSCWSPPREVKSFSSMPGRIAIRSSRA